MLRDLLGLAGWAAAANALAAALALAIPSAWWGRMTAASHNITVLLACLGIAYLVIFGLLHACCALPYPLAKSAGEVTAAFVASSAVSKTALAAQRRWWHSPGAI